MLGILHTALRTDANVEPIASRSRSFFQAFKAKSGSRPAGYVVKAVQFWLWAIQEGQAILVQAEVFLNTTSG